MNLFQKCEKLLLDMKHEKRQKKDKIGVGLVIKDGTKYTVW